MNNLVCNFEFDGENYKMELCERSINLYHNDELLYHTFINSEGYTEIDDRIEYPVDVKELIKFSFETIDAMTRNILWELSV